VIGEFRRRCRDAKCPTIAKDLVTGFTELADALETGSDIGKRFNRYTKQLDLRPETYSPQMVWQARKWLAKWSVN
jgi:hypothetical protein